MIEVGDRVVLAYRGHHTPGLSGPYPKNTFNAEHVVYEVLALADSWMANRLSKLALIQPCPVVSPHARRYAGEGKWIGKLHLQQARIRVAAKE